VAKGPGGIGSIAVRKTLVELQAFGEIMGVPGPQLDVILAKAREELEQKEIVPPFVPPGPPPPPPPIP